VSAAEAGQVGQACTVQPGSGAEPGCITCGDVAVVLTVTQVSGADARCRDEQGREELVAIELVGDVGPGQRLLVHAGVAIERLAAAATGE
jgi:hydrogenase maturation factor